MGLVWVVVWMQNGQYVGCVNIATPFFTPTLFIPPQSKQKAAQLDDHNWASTGQSILIN